MGTVFKSFLWLTLLFIVAICSIGFFLPRQDKVVVEKEIACSPETAFAMVNDLKNWEQWSPWHRYDPQMKLTYSSPSAGNEAWYTWEGNDRVGKGKLSIAKSTPTSSIDMLLNYNYDGEVNSGFDFVPSTNGTTVKWRIDMAKIKNPLLNKMLGGYSYLLMKFFIEKDFAAGLNNLNEVCSKK